MSHVVLLGDSIFDNAAYVEPGEPDVVAQLRERLPEQWEATLLAVDGHEIRDVPGQLARLPTAASHLVLSVGGNDALGNVGILEEPARSIPEALDRLAAIADPFEGAYRRTVASVLETELPTALCTIYYPAFPEPLLQRFAVTALTVFNDAILRVAFDHGLPVLDLRLICDSPEDYANPIEPSSRGGARIADVIVEVVTGHDFPRGRTSVYTG